VAGGRGCRPSKLGDSPELAGQHVGSVEHGLSDAGGFVKGIGEGACDGVKGTVSGAAHLAEDGYKLATDSRYHEPLISSQLP
jgi:hypothetical protein